MTEFSQETAEAIVCMCHIRKNEIHVTTKNCKPSYFQVYVFSSRAYISQIILADVGLQGKLLFFFFFLSFLHYMNERPRGGRQPEQFQG